MEEISINERKIAMYVIANAVESITTDAAVQAYIASMLTCTLLRIYVQKNDIKNSFLEYVTKRKNSRITKNKANMLFLDLLKTRGKKKKKGRSAKNTKLLKLAQMHAQARAKWVDIEKWEERANVKSVFDTAAEYEWENINVWMEAERVVAHYHPSARKKENKERERMQMLNFETETETKAVERPFHRHPTTIKEVKCLKK